MAPSLGKIPRIVAGVIGIIWIVAGVAVGMLCIPAHQWGSVLLCALANYFGGFWLHVARKGRYVVWPFGS